MGDRAIALSCSAPGCDYTTVKQAPPFNLSQFLMHHKVAHSIDSGGGIYPMAMPLPGRWGNMQRHKVVCTTSTTSSSRVTSTIKEGARVEGGEEGVIGGRGITEPEKRKETNKKDAAK